MQTPVLGRALCLLSCAVFAPAAGANGCEAMRGLIVASAQNGGGPGGTVSGG